MAPQWWDHNRLLERGSRGEDVKRLQQALNKEVSTASTMISETGIFDAATEARLKEFQRLDGLMDDGKAGPITQSAIFGGSYAFSIARPPVVRQGLNQCWAASTEAVLKSTWVGRPISSVAELMAKYAAFLNTQGLISDSGMETVMVDHRASRKFFAGNELSVEKISAFLFRHGKQIILGDFARGSGHVTVIFGVTVQDGTPALMVMDPLTGYSTVNLGTLQGPGASVFLAAPFDMTVVNEL
jgi:Putative peptidoglycan binding domain/Papain-like cysteine protease AvrRpt2